VIKKTSEELKRAILKKGPRLSNPMSERPAAPTVKRKELTGHVRELTRERVGISRGEPRASPRKPVVRRKLAIKGSEQENIFRMR